MKGLSRSFDVNHCQQNVEREMKTRTKAFTSGSYCQLPVWGNPPRRKLRLAQPARHHIVIVQ